MSHGYAVVNAAASLAAASFTWSTGYVNADRAYLVDGALDRLAQNNVAPDTVPYSVVIDFGAAVTLSGWALLNHNMSTWVTPTVLIEAGDNAAITINPVTAKVATAVNVVMPNHKDAYFDFSAVPRTKRYWRITFNDNAGGDYHLTIGELFAVNALTVLTRKKIYGHGESNAFRTNSVEMANGEARTSFRSGPLRSKLFPFAGLNTATKLELYTMWNACRGGATKLLWVEWLNAGLTPATLEQECMLGRLQPNLDWTEPDYYNFDVSTLELRACAREIGS